MIKSGLHLFTSQLVMVSMYLDVIMLISELLSSSAAHQHSCICNTFTQHAKRVPADIVHCVPGQQSKGSLFQRFNSACDLSYNLCHGCCCCTGGGCGVGLGLGWGFGAAWGSKYIIIESEFESGQEQGKPRWLAQLQQQLRIQKFEKNHQA